MTRRLLSSVMVMLFISAGYAGGSDWPGGDGGRADPVTMLWSPDYRLTDNPSADGSPQLSVRVNGSVAVGWARGNYLMYERIDRNATVLVSEKTLASGVPVQNAGFRSPYMASDSSGNIHVVLTPGGTSPRYAKYDSNGGELVAPSNFCPGASSPDKPSIAVSGDGIVSIVYGDYRFGYGAKAVTYARILSDGTVDRDGVRFSEAGWYCDGSTIALGTDGSVHSTFINTAQGAYHAMLDKDGNPLPQAPPAYLYKSGDYRSNPPPWVACDGTGGVHIIWNSGADGAGTLMYLKLDCNGNKLASGWDGVGIPLTYSPTCRGYPSIAGDERGNAYAVWTDNRDGSDKIYWLLLQPGKENDTDLPGRAICLTPDTGSASEPKVAADDVGSLHVVWADRRDGNPEIYYKSSISAGAELRMSLGDRERLAGIEPNETKVAYLKVKNNGTWADTVSLNLTVEYGGTTGGTGIDYGGDGWKLWLHDAELATPLQSGEERSVIFCVRGPRLGHPNDRVDVTVNATAGRDPFNGSVVKFGVVLHMSNRVSLSCVETSKETAPKIGASYLLKVANIGYTEDLVQLSARGPPGWAWALSLDETRLLASDNTTFELSVTPPPDALTGWDGEVKVSARSAMDPQVSDHVITTTTVSLVASLEISADRYEAVVDPGGTAAFCVTVLNRGNMGAQAVFIVSASLDRPAWNMTVGNDSFWLAGEQAATTAVLVRAPADAVAGSAAEAHLACREVQGPLRAECDLTVTVRTIHGLRLVGSGAGLALDPGGSASGTLSMENLGNLEETVRPGPFAVPPLWSASYYLSDGRELSAGDHLPLAIGGSVQLSATFGAPEGALAGDYALEGSMVDSAGNGRSVGWKATVNGIRRAGLEAETRLISAGAGRPVAFALTVRNLGNCPDDIGLELSALPAGWNVAGFDRPDGQVVSEILLGPSEAASVFLELRIPSATQLDSLDFSASANPSEGPGASVNLTVRVLKADLAISRIEFEPPAVAVGLSSAMKISVANLGDFEADNVTLTVFRDRLMQSVENLGTVQPGATSVATIFWVPVRGENSWKLVLDLPDRIPEKDETNNVAFYEKGFPAGRVVDRPDNGWIPVAISISVLAVVVAAGCLVHMSNVRRARQRKKDGAF